MGDRRSNQQSDRNSVYSRPVPTADGDQQTVIRDAQQLTAQPIEASPEIQAYQVFGSLKGSLICPLTTALGRHPWSNIPFSGKPKSNLAGNFTSKKEDLAGGRLCQKGVRDKDGVGKVMRIKWTRPKAAGDWKVFEPVAGGTLRRQGHINKADEQVVDKLSWHRDPSKSDERTGIARLLR